MKKFISVITILGCLIFIILGLYGYFVLHRATLQDLIMIILLCGVLIIVEIVEFTSKCEGRWGVKSGELSKKQNIIMAVCGLIFGFGSLLVFFKKDNIFLKIILLVGFLFFTIGSMHLLIKQFKVGKE